MPKVGMAPVRRKQLIDATIHCLHAEGFNRTTVSRVAKRAHLSPGLVTHYFEDKHGLLVATLRELNRRLSAATVRRLRMATSPLDRLEAVAVGQFDEKEFTPQLVSAWFALWGNLHDLPGIQRFQTIYERRLRSNLRSAARPLVAADRLDLTVDTIASLIDGLWLKGTVMESGIDGARARAIMHDHLSRIASP